MIQIYPSAIYSVGYNLEFAVWCADFGWRTFDFLFLQEVIMLDQFAIENGVLVSYSGTDTTITIPSIVVKIGKGAFKNSSVRQVEFSGNNIYCIEEEAFCNCKNLEFLQLPYGLIQIGKRAFCGCLNLQYIYLPSTIAIVEEQFLESCNPRLVVLGEKNSEAEKAAEKYAYAFHTNSREVITALQTSKSVRSQMKTKEFILWGETIQCSNSLKKYHEILNHNITRKEPFYEQFQKMIPLSIPGHFGDVVKLLDGEQMCLMERLSNAGVFIQKKRDWPLYFQLI